MPGLGNVASRSKELESKLRHTDCRLPGHLYDLRYKIRNAADKLASLLQRTPTDAEVAEHLNMPIKKVLNIKSVRALLCKQTSRADKASSGGMWTSAVCTLRGCLRVEFEHGCWIFPAAACVPTDLATAAAAAWI